MSEQLKKRLSSFAWRLSVAILLVVIAEVTKFLPSVGWPEAVTGVVILALNEVTKWLNSKYELGSSVLAAFRK
jgi:hypothetical protein